MENQTVNEGKTTAIISHLWIIGLIIMNFISRGAIKVAAHRVAKGERSSATLEILSHLGFMIALIAISFVALWR